MKKDTEDSRLDQLLQGVANEPRWIAPQTTLYKNRFVIERLVGSGGMGVVYRAHDNRHGTSIALKTLLSANSSAIYRLKQEFRALADLVHPNLVGLHELFFDEALNQWFFTMDLVPGDPLLERLGPSPDEADVRGAFYQLAVGIQAIHAEGKLHRDLKPSNVIVTPEDRVVILDFGLVSDQNVGGVGQTTTDDSASGTPLYMSPEQGAGEPATFSSDWYAFGAMLFEVLTGRPPFTGSDRKVLTQKQLEDAPKPSTIRQDIPKDLESLCARLLMRDPGARPDFEKLVSVFHAQSTTSEIPAEPEQDVFVGREDELSALQAAFASTDQGQPAIALVEGVSGIGKTALVERFLWSLKRRGEAVILSGRCYKRESVPYKACDSVVDALSRYLRKISPARAAAMMPRHIHALAQMFPALKRLEVIQEIKQRYPLPADPVELRRFGFSALKELLLRIAEQVPLVLFVDDLQWMDVDSARLLSSLFDPPDPPSMLLVGAFRSDEISGNPGLSALHDQFTTQTELAVIKVALGPLSADESRILAHRLLSAGIEKQATSIAAEAEGSPFFIVELSHHSATGPSQATTLVDLIASRVSSIAATQRDLLEAICISARPVESDLLQFVVAGDDVAQSMRELMAQKLIRYKSGSSILLTCYHDRTRETVVSLLPESRHEMWHRRFSKAMERQKEPDLLALTEHYLGAKEYKKAGERAIDAASHAAHTLAFNKAVEMYRVAIEHADLSDARRIELRVALAETLTNGMRCAEAGREYLDISARVGPEERGEIRRKGAEQLLFSGHIEEGIAVLKEAFEDNGVDYAALLQQNPFDTLSELEATGFEYTIRSDFDPAELRRLDLMWAAGLGMTQIKEAEAMVFLTAYATKALEVGELLHVVRALAFMSIYRSIFGKEGNLALVRLRELSSNQSDPTFRAWRHMALANDAFWFGRFSESITEFERAESVLMQECTGVARELSSVRFVCSLAFSYLRDMDSIWSVSSRWLGEARESENIHLTANVTASTNRWIVIDRPDIATREIKELLAQLSEEYDVVALLLGRMLLARCESYQGERDVWDKMDAAVREFDSTLYAASPMLKCSVHYHRCIVALAQARNHENPEALLRCAENDVQIIQNPIAIDGTSLRFSYWSSLGVLLSACIAAARGDMRAAHELIDEALDIMAGQKDKNHLAEKSARYRKGQLIGGEVGAALSAEAITALKDGGVKNPARWNAFITPGFETL